MARTDGLHPDELHLLLVAAFRPHAARRIRRLGVADSPELGASLATGEEWLSDELARVLALPLSEQRRAPLEIFQEAMRFPTAVLAAAGVSPVDRDPVAIAAMPGDVYDLAPASSRELGDDVWRAHIAWGISKAEAVAGVVPGARAVEDRSEHALERQVPLVALLGTDLMDRSKIEPVVTARGMKLVVWRNPAAVAAGLETPPVLALVDLSHAAADEVLRTLAVHGIRTCAFGPHVDDLAMARARALGAQEVLARSRFFVRLPELLPQLT